MRPFLLVHRARIVHAVVVDRQRRTGIVIRPDAWVKTSLDEFDLLAAQLPVRIGHQFGALGHAEVIPAHALLPHPLLDVPYVLVEMLVNIVKDLFALHHSTL